MEDLKNDLVNDVVDQIIDDVRSCDIEAIEGLIYSIYSKSNVNHMVDYLCYDKANIKYNELLK